MKNYCIIKTTLACLGATAFLAISCYYQHTGHTGISYSASYDMGICVGIALICSRRLKPEIPLTINTTTVLGILGTFPLLIKSTIVGLALHNSVLAAALLPTGAMIYCAMLLTTYPWEKDRIPAKAALKSGNR